MHAVVKLRIFKPFTLILMGRGSRANNYAVISFFRLRAPECLRVWLLNIVMLGVHMRNI